jgi:hypothetical protein
MAQFAIPTPDENLVPGWNVQGNFASVSTVGEPGQGYASPAAVPAPTAAYNTQSQANAGYPNPPGAFNIGSENSGSYTSSILTNPGYADGSTQLTQAPVTLAITTAGVQNPFGMSAQVTATLSTSVTALYVSPFQAAGQPSGTSSPWVAVVSGAPAGSEIISFMVPPGGYAKTTGAATTATTWTPTY